MFCVFIIFLYIIQYNNILRPPLQSHCDSHPCDPPHPKIRGTRLPNPRIDAFNQILVCPPNIDDKSMPMQSIQAKWQISANVQHALVDKDVAWILK